MRIVPRPKYIITLKFRFVKGNGPSNSVTRCSAIGTLQMSCQHAMPQGKFAGHNAVNVMFGKEPISYLQPQYATCLDMGPENALLTNGWERNVEMFGSEAKALKSQIVTQWICPAGSVEETLKMSAPEVLTA